MTLNPFNNFNQRTSALGGLLLVSIIWGATFTVTQYILNLGISVEILLCLRFSLGTLALGLILLGFRQNIDTYSLHKGLWLGIICALIFWLQTDGLKHTTATKSGFITGLYVIFTPVVAIFLGDRMNRNHWLGAFIAIAGLSLLIYDPNESWGGWSLGETETLLSAILIGVHIALMARYSKRANSLVLALVQVFIIALCMGLLAGFRTTKSEWASMHSLLLTSTLWIPLAYLALLATALSFWLQSELQAHVSATEAGIIFSLEPVIGAFIAASGWIPGIQDQLTKTAIIGAGVIMAGIIISQMKVTQIQPIKKGTL